MLTTGMMILPLYLGTATAAVVVIAGIGIVVIAAAAFGGCGAIARGMIRRR